ncbi:unnamed protein product [Alternaria alternata]
MRNARGVPAGSSGTWVTAETTESSSDTRHQGSTTSDSYYQPSRNVTVFGQVVADDSLGDVYMVPLCDILEDVKQLFNAREARLPESNSEVDSILRRGNNSPGAMRDDIAAAGLLENEAGATLGHSETAFCSRCGSDKHTREICGVDDPANNRGEELKAVMVPVEVASHDPNEKWRGSGKANVAADPKAETTISRSTSQAKRAAKIAPRPKPTKSDKVDVTTKGSTPSNVTARTITHELVKKPIQCHQYTPSSSNSSPTLIFTHGAGGTLSADAVVNFSTGFSEYLPVLAFQGSMNLKARTKGFHACIEETHSSQKTTQKRKSKEQIKRKRMLLGGRSMGARAAVIAASEHLAEQDHEQEDMSIQLILVSYPLQGPKDDLRDQILLDLPESIGVLFIIGDKDAMCPLDLLNETRSKMVAKSQVVVVRDADHGMNIKPASATKEVGESTGRVAAWWVEGDLKGDVQYIGKQEE